MERYTVRHENKLTTIKIKSKTDPLTAMQALSGRGDIAPSHS
jgi:hypothetical protein